MVTCLVAIGDNSQDIAVTRGDGPVVDYSVLYDGIVRTTLWEEVNSFFPFWQSKFWVFQFPLNAISQLSLYKDTDLIDLAFHKTDWTFTN